MVIEDTHWAGEATLDVIKYLGRRIARTNGLLVLTYRDGEVDYDHPLRQVIGELPPENLVRIYLDRLSVGAIADLAGDSHLNLDTVFALSDGNPLFVNELLKSGVKDVPTSVQDSVLARAAKLSKGARALLDLVSVIPAGSEVVLVESILGPSQSEVTECVRQGLLAVGEDSVAFHHELTRRSIESALTARNRLDLNRQSRTTFPPSFPSWDRRIETKPSLRLVTRDSLKAPSDTRVAGRRINSNMSDPISYMSSSPR